MAFGVAAGEPPVAAGVPAAGVPVPPSSPPPHAARAKSRPARTTAPGTISNDDLRFMLTSAESIPRRTLAIGFSLFTTPFSARLPRLASSSDTLAEALLTGFHAPHHQLL